MKQKDSFSYSVKKIFTALGKPHYELFLVLTIYLLLGLIVFRDLLLDSGTIGHHWDWSIPPTDYYLVRRFDTLMSAWEPIFFGGFNRFTIARAPLDFAFGLAGLLGFSGDFVSKFLIVFTVLVSGSSMYFLTKHITRSTVNLPKILRSRKTMNLHLPALVSGYFYALSPFLFNELIGGANTQFLPYSFAPLVFLFFLRSQSEASIRWNYVIATSIVFSLLSMSLQTTSLLFALIFIYAIVDGKKAIKSMIVLVTLWLLINAYWILPNLLLMKTETAFLGSWLGSTENVLERIGRITPTLTNAFTVAGYPQDLLIGSIPELLYTPWIFCVYLALSITTLFTLILRPKNKQVLFWWAIVCVALILVTGSKPPLENFVRFFYENLRLISMGFDSPQHFIFLLPFSYAILLGIATKTMLHIFKKRAFRVKAGSLRGQGSCSYMALGITLLLLTVWVFPFYSGNLGGLVDVYELPPSYDNINTILREVGDDGSRVLYIPMAGSPLYLNTPYQSQSQGGDPLVFNSLLPAVVVDTVTDYDTKRFTTLIGNLIGEDAPPSQTSKLLGLANVQYIILRKDVEPNFDLSDRWNYTQTYLNLQNMSDIVLIEEFEYASLWENKYVFPRIYAIPSKLLVDNQDIGDIIALPKYFPPNVLTNPSFEIAGEAFFEHYNASDGQDLHGGAPQRLKSHEGVQLLAQTFEAYDSIVDSVSLFIKKFGSPDGNLKISLTQTRNSLPTGEALVSTVVPVESVPSDWNWINVRLRYEDCVPGETYAIVLNKTKNTLDWENCFAWGLRDEADHYENGRAYMFNGQTLEIIDSTVDFSFKVTYQIQEVKRFPVKWDFERSSGDDSTWKVINNDAYHGNCSVMIKKLTRSGMFTLTSDTVSIFENTRYTLSFFYKTDRKDVQFAADIVWVDREGRVIGETGVKIDGAENWKRYSITTLSPPENTRTKAYIKFTVFNTVILQLDAIQLKEGEMSENFYDYLEDPREYLGDISFSKLSPSMYEVQINTTEPLFLVLGDTFHPGWKAYEGKTNWFEAIWKKPISDEHHFKINCYANAWYIDKVGNYVITLYFWPQTPLYVSLVISTTVVCLSFMIIISLRKKGTKRPRARSERLHEA